jgi:hypothetical protein
MYMHLYLNILIHIYIVSIYLFHLDDEPVNYWAEDTVTYALLAGPHYFCEY